MTGRIEYTSDRSHGDAATVLLHAGWRDIRCNYLISCEVGCLRVRGNVGHREMLLHLKYADHLTPIFGRVCYGVFSVCCKTKGSAENCALKRARLHKTTVALLAIKLIMDIRQGMKRPGFRGYFLNL